MNGTRVWNRRFQVSSTVFYKREKTLLLQGMVHWGANEFFCNIQHKIDVCKGIIVKEDTGYLDPAELLELDDDDFDMFCSQMDRKTDVVRAAMMVLLGLRYQWDILKYPSPPQALCADVNWREACAFDSYMHVTSEASHNHRQEGLDETVWDMLISSGAQGSMLLNGLIYRCFQMIDQRKVVHPREEMTELFLTWSEKHRFKNPRKASSLFYDIVRHFVSNFGELEPEQKAFLFDKRESRVLKLIEKIERLDYVPEILITYGAGHFDTLKRRIKSAGWKLHGSVAWTTVWTFAPSPIAAMMRALDAVTSV